MRDDSIDVCVVHGQPVDAFAQHAAWVCRVFDAWGRVLEARREGNPRLEALFTAERDQAAGWARAWSWCWAHHRAWDREHARMRREYEASEPINFADYERAPAGGASGKAAGSCPPASRCAVRSNGGGRRLRLRSGSWTSRRNAAGGQRDA